MKFYIVDVDIVVEVHQVQVMVHVVEEDMLVMVHIRVHMMDIVDMTQKDIEEKVKVHMKVLVMVEAHRKDIVEIKEEVMKVYVVDMIEMYIEDVEEYIVNI